MRSWTFLPDCGFRPRLPAVLVVGSLIATALTGGIYPAAAAAGDWRPWLEISSGHESDLVLDPEFSRIVVPGGGFLEGTLGLTWSQRLSARSRFDLSGRTSFERFFNGERRLLGGSSLRGELYWRGPSRWLVRLAAGGSHFSDSERPTVERLDGGMEAALGLVSRRWRLELVGTASGRRYPELETADLAGRLATYTESSGGLGLSGAVEPIVGVTVWARAFRQETDARDPLFDNASWYWQGTAWWRLNRRLSLLTDAIYQQRDYRHRSAEQDRDRFIQCGVGLEHRWTDSLGLAGRFAWARYEYPTGERQDTHRISLAVSYRWGRQASGPRAIEDAILPGEAVDLPRAGQPHVFRLCAPEAERVALVGDFNGWDPTRNIMARDRDGCWQVAMALPAGAHQYAFWVDGEIRTPPAAEATVADGFGGRNGLLRILP